MVSEHRLSQEQVKELQRAVQDREKRLKTATDQLQKLEKTASNVVMMRQHSKQQSETIVQLRKQLEATGAKVHVHVHVNTVYYVHLHVVSYYCNGICWLLPIATKFFINCWLPESCG